MRVGLTSRFRAIWCAAALAGLLTSCGPPRVCTPGSTQLCNGPGACVGSQSCDSNGLGFGTCVCGGSQGGGAGGGGGASGGAGGGGTGGGIDGGADGGVIVDAGVDGGSDGGTDAGTGGEDAGRDAGSGDSGVGDAGIVDAGPKPLVTCPGSVMGTVNRPLMFAASGSDPAGMALSFNWRFSDGAMASGASVTHAFSDAGTHSANVTATSSDARSSDPCTTSVTVTPRIDRSGVWLLSPSSSMFSGSCPFTVPFPSTATTLAQATNPDAGEDIMTANPTGSNYPAGFPLTGTEDPTTPGMFVLRAMTPNESPGGTCSLSIAVTHVLRLSFSSATSGSGSWTKVYDATASCTMASCASCSCVAGGSALGAFSAARQ